MITQHYKNINLYYKKHERNWRTRLWSHYKIWIGLGNGTGPITGPHPVPSLICNIYIYIYNHVSSCFSRLDVMLYLVNSLRLVIDHICRCRAWADDHLEYRRYDVFCFSFGKKNREAQPKVSTPLCEKMSLRAPKFVRLDPLLGVGLISLNV